MRSQKAIRGGRRSHTFPPRRKRRPLPRPTCWNGGKVRYGAEVEALTALATIAARPPKERDGRKPIRAYRCPSCGGWHLTSLPKSSK